MVKCNLVERKPVSADSRDKRPALGVIDALSAGLEGVLRHPWLLLIPVALDLFLWVGPRLEAPLLYRQFEPTLRQLVTEMPSSNARLAAQELGVMLEDFFTHYNIFSALSVSLVGVPVINAGSRVLALESPLLVWQVADLDTYLLTVIAATLLGLFGAALYWSLLGGHVRGERLAPSNWLRESWRMWKLLVLLLLCLIAFVFMSVFPLSMLMLTLAAFSPGLASLVPLLAFGFLGWLILMAVFTPHGLALYRVTLSQALRMSMLVVRYNFAPTLGLLTLAFSISMGMNLIWEGVPFNSILRLIAVIGNAVIGTGLILASLLYYQNRSVLLHERFHWPLPGQTGHPTSQP